MSSTQSPVLDVERAVKNRYGAAAREREDALCCPVDYDTRYLKAIPSEVLERDYGCGDPSRYVEEGDVVLDLGSGGGKICFIASQIAGPSGRVIGVDMNDDMLDLARRAAPLVAENVGFSNTRFVRGRIQDLGLDVDRLDAWLDAHPVKNSDHIAALEAEMQRLRDEEPLVADASVDIVVSNCVLNLVHPDAKQQLIREIYRVLKRGGRIAISDIVSDEPVPAALRTDPELWSGCISGAFEERELLEALETAGFHGIVIDKWEAEPFAVVEGIEFRSVTLTAHKGKQGASLEANEAVIYAGPWKQVEDDDGHVLRRGERTAVCAKTYSILTRAPYAEQLIPLPPRVSVPEAERGAFDCVPSARRDPRESKGADYTASRKPEPSGCC
ncbi:MAG: methyltransferase domain-containing protein [Deltaproteobacteria bacterium]|nr:methyltransferase domain-containing protein [Deltaproteobacteria bacterium]MBW2362338.1 methyltransferase domain-containing protein [Deltaproteobacteria bacterium]